MHFIFKMIGYYLNCSTLYSGMKEQTLERTNQSRTDSVIVPIVSLPQSRPDSVIVPSISSPV